MPVPRSRTQPSQTYNASERDERDADGEQVTGLEKVNRLEGLFAGHSLLLGEVDERVDVLHAGEVRDRLLDLLHASGFDAIGGPEQHRRDCEASVLATYLQRRVPSLRSLWKFSRSPLVLICSPDSCLIHLSSNSPSCSLYLDACCKTIYSTVPIHHSCLKR